MERENMAAHAPLVIEWVPTGRVCKIIFTTLCPKCNLDHLVIVADTQTGASSSAWQVLSGEYYYLNRAVQWHCAKRAEAYF